MTLDEIGDLIRLGENIRVVDHETGADLTAVTLAQVILEQEKKIGGLLPQRILTRFIRDGNDTISGLREAMQIFLDPQGYVEKDILRRLNLLMDREIISAEERQRLETLLLDASLSPSSQSEEEVSLEEVQSLLEKIQLLEKELDQLQQSQD